MTNFEIIKEEFNKFEKLKNITDDKLKQFIKYYEMLISYNEKVNLTAITDFKEVIYKHFIDSILMSDLFEKNKTLVDIGSGAGFPALAIKIFRPDLKITLVDSLNKRIVFLNSVINELKLDHITAIHSRAEDFAKDNREKFDYSTARAVARLNILSEYCLPLVKINGHFLAYKSCDNEELSESKNAIKTLGGKVIDTPSYSLNEFGDNRNIIIIKKLTKSPTKYPRGKNLPRTNPLV